MIKENLTDENERKSLEEKLLLDIYRNMLYPPPIGKYNKDLLFDTSLNMTNLSPILYKNRQIVLGDGSFSKVKLYENKKTKIKYAVKKMNLKQLEKLPNSKRLVYNEVNIQGRINHPNIIRLFNFFKNNSNCYLILEYASKGTLFEMIRKSSGLSERIAFYYFIQTLNAIYFLHLHSIIHRDLKPENLLINENNILKLCDFGWSVKLNNNKRTTFCGTVEYMAPEIIKKQKYDETIDVWSLGVLLYELVHSYSPFYSEDLDIKKIGINIIQNELIFREGLSDEYKNLVKKILIKDSSKRIKLEEIYQHPFMTKHINVIYREINSNNDILKIINEKESNKRNSKNSVKKMVINKKIHDNLCNTSNTTKNNKNIAEIIYKNREKMKNKGCFYKKIKILNKNNQNEANDNTNSNNNFKLENKSKELQSKKQKIVHNLQMDGIKRDTNFIFASIPTEPEPKLIPDSHFYKEIKKVKTNILNFQKKGKEQPYHDISNTSRNKKNIKGAQKEQKIKTLFKNTNKISHVKSFSLGQNDINFSEIKDNRLKIIISINNTQNRNYIKKNKSRKVQNLSTKNKKSLSKYLEDNNCLQCSSSLGIYNKNTALQQTMVYNTIKKSNNSAKNNKIINQTYLFEHKNILNSKPNSNSNNNIIKYNPIEFNDYVFNYDLNKYHQNHYIKNDSYMKNNYIKTDNNINYPYISMINNNNSNTFSNIIINSNSPKKLIKEKNIFKLKKIIKNSNSSNEYSTYLRRINSDSYKKIQMCYNNKKSRESNREIIEKIKNMNNNKKLNTFRESKRLSKNEIRKNNKSSIINKIIDKSLKKDLNKTININYSSQFKNDNNYQIEQNLTQNFDSNLLKQYANTNLNSREKTIKNSKISSKNNNNSSKNKKIIKISNANKIMINDAEGDIKITENSPKNSELFKEQNLSNLYSALKSKPIKILKFHECNKSIKSDLKV